jgi:hypothetical protein
LNVLFDVFVTDGFPIIVNGREEHSWSVIILIIDNVHCIVSNILFFDDFFLSFSWVEYNYFASILTRYLLFVSALYFADSFFALSFLQHYVLFILIEVLRTVVWVIWGFPLPTWTDFS